MNKFFLLILILPAAFANGQESASYVDTIIPPAFNRSIFFEKSLNNNTIQLLSYTEINKLSLLYSAGYYTGSESYYYNSIPKGQSFTYLDGMRVRDISDFPISAIESYTLYTSDSPIRYGNSLAGIASIESVKATDNISAEINIVSSFTRDGGININQRCMNFTFSGPFKFGKRPVKNVKRVPSFLIAGNINLMHDPFRSYTKSTYLNDELLSQLQDAPLQPSGTGFGSYLNAEFIEKDDFATTSLRQNADKNAFCPFVRIDLPLNENMNITIGSFINYTKGRLFVYENALFNSSLNPDQMNRNFDNYARFNHTVIKNQNLKIRYQLQINYSNYFNCIQSNLHKNNFFDYGYVGKFKTYKIKSYEWGSDTVLGIDNIWVHNGFRDTLFAFENSDINPLLSNYNIQYYNFYPSNYYQNSILVQNGGGLLNGQPPQSAYGLWNNTGYQFDLYHKQNECNFRPEAFVSIDIKKKHHLLLGFENNRIKMSEYDLAPVGLWTLMRQLVNKHIQQLDYAHPHPLCDINGVFSRIQYGTIGCMMLRCNHALIKT
jgi:hypothetical protein